MQMIFPDQRRLLFVLLLLLLAGLSEAQTATDSIISAKRYKDRYLLWTTPTRSKSINGVAIGLQAMHSDDKKLTVNGINTGLGGLGFIAVPAFVFLSALGDEPMDPFENTAATIINGVSVSVGGELFVGINGVNLSGVITHASHMNGVSVSGLVSVCTKFRGIIVGGIFNTADAGTGLQIGLFNNCNTLKGLQVGLWNKNGKRGLPIINWSF